MHTILLTHTWTVEYFEPNVDPFEMAPSPQPIARLQDWACDRRYAQAQFYGWLQHVFELTPTDGCVRYTLQIEGAPPQTRIYVNDLLIAESSQPIVRQDITDAVTLGKNRLNLRVMCASSAPTFESAVLLQIPCDAAD
jgi:hypothetical protein